MNQNKLLKKLGFLLVMLIFTAGSALAQTYVSATDGDDGAGGDGTITKPYLTIGKGITETTAGGTVIVEPGTYAEDVTVAKALTIRAQDFGSNGGTAVIMQDLTLNMATGTDVLSFGETGMPFNIDDLTLTSGVMNVATANVVVASGQTITRTNGSLNLSPTVTNVNVAYGATSGDITAGGELPADLGTGTLNVNIGGANTLTVGSAFEAASVTVTTGDVNFASVTSAGAVAIIAGDVSFTNLTTDGNVTITAGNTTVSSTLTLNNVFIVNNGTGDVTLNNVTVNLTAALASTIDNNATGTIAVNGNLTYNHDGGAAVDYNTDIDNNSTGAVSVANPIVRPASGGANPGQFVDVDIIQPAAGTIDLGGGTIEDVVSNGGTIDFNADMTIAGTTVANGGTMQTNANTLTFTGAGAALSGGGFVISTAAATVGSGEVDFTQAITVTQAELPNAMVSGPNGILTLAADVDVLGDFTLSSPVAGALTDGGFDLGVNGDFTRSDNTLGNVVATGTLSMDGAGNANLNAGTQLTLNDVEIDKDALATTVDLSATLRINGDFTITTGTVELNTYHIRMQGGGPGVFTNGSGGYVSAGGLLIIEANTNLDGASVYSNIDVRSGAQATVLAATLKFSGTLYLTDGDLDVNGNVFQFVDDLVTTPQVIVYTTTANPGTMTLSAGTVNTESASVYYDLSYTDVGDATAGAEWIAGGAAVGGIRNLHVNTGGAVPAANTITGPAADTWVHGNVTVDLNQTLQLDNVAARTLNLVGDGAAHSVVGRVSSTGGASVVEVDANGASLAGTTSTAAGSWAEVPNLDLDLAIGESFTSSNLKDIAGDLQMLTDGSADIDMNTTSANIGGDVNLTNGTLDLNMASTASTHGGDIAITDGDLTYTRGGAGQRTIGGAVTLTAGSMTLGSDVTVTGVTSHVAGDLILGANNYVATTANYTRTGTGTLTGTGSLVIGAIVLTPGTTFVVPNLVLDGAATIAAAMEVSNSLTHTSGAVNYANLTFSGNTYLYESTAGAITGAFTLSGSAVNATFEQNATIPTLTINSSGSVNILSDGATPRTVTVSAAFTQTNGDVSLGINSLTVTGTFTNSADNINSTTGFLNLNTAAPSVANGFTVDNLDMQGAGNFGTSTFTVNNNLLLTAGALTTSADDKLVLGDGLTITRTAGSLTQVPTFGATTNLIYNSGGATTAGDEQPATVNDYTIAAATTVTLSDDVTIAGTLSIAGSLAHTNPGNTCTMADGSTLELLVVGTAAVTGADLVKAGAMDLIYGAAVTTSSRELGTLAANAYPTFTGNITVEGNLTLDGDITVDGKLTLDGGSVVMAAAAAGDMVTLLGDFEQTAGEWFITNPGTVVLAGPNDADFMLSGDQVVDANSDIVLNKTNENSKVTLSGGDLDFATTPRNITLTKGLFDTDATSKIILDQANNGLGQPTHGFTRTDGVIVGNVEKFLLNTAAVDISTVIFPTGSNSNYRPAVFYFKTAPGSSINLMVNHEEESPGGSNGIPIDLPGQSITNYPDFYWFVQSDVALAPSYEFDFELQAEGYTEYVLDGIQNVRLIRRDSGNVANPWVLQGDDANYDNSTIAANHPLVKVINAEGGITTQGSRFTYSQADKDPVFDSALNDTTVAETDTLEFTYVASDPDIGGSVTLSAVTLPEGATFNGATGEFAWATDYDDAGDHDVTIRATDANANTTDTTAVVTVTNLNRVPVWTAVPDSPVSIGEGDEYTFQLEATDADMDALAYSNVPNVPAPDSVSVTTAGMLTIIPDFGEEGNSYTVTVRVDDSMGGVVDSSFTVDVVKTNLPPVLARVDMVDTLMIDEGALGTLTYTATDPDGDNLAYSLSELGGDTTNTAAMVDSVFTWTPSYTSAGTYNFEVTVTDDGSPNKSDMDTLVVVVAPANAPPVWVSELPDTTVFLGNTLEWTYEASDLDMDAISYEFNGNNPAEATLDPVSGEFSWAPATELQFPVLIKVLATDGSDTIYTQAEVIVEVVTVTVSGTVSYNVSMIALEGVTVNLMDGATVVATDETDAAGAYSFADVSAGSYTVMAAKTTGWGGSLASDALSVALYAIGDTAQVATDMQKVAGDVVLPGDPPNPNTGDALRILQKSVDPNDITYPGYDIADWQFESFDLTVGTSDLTQDILGIAAGDARSDYDPTGALAKSLVSARSDESQKVSLKKEFPFELKAIEGGNFGSFTMSLSVPASKLEVVSVDVAGNGSLAYTREGDVLTIAWADFTGKNTLKVAEGGTFAVVTMKAAEGFAKMEEFAPALLFGEMTDDKANRLAKSVGLATIIAGVPDKYALAQNYPNPFNPSTTIQYDLPENGKVNLAIYNTLGEQVANLVDTRQEAGSYEVKWNAANLASGVYLYRLHVDGAKGFVLTKKMILMK